MLEEKLNCAMHSVDSKLVVNLVEPFFSGANRRDLRVHVPNQNIGNAGIEPENIYNVLPCLAPAEDLGAGEYDAFLVHAVGIKHIPRVLCPEVNPVSPEHFVGDELRSPIYKDG